MSQHPSTPDEDRLAQAEALLRGPAGLGPFIAFTRRFDPSADLRERWGENFEARRDWLMQKSRDMLAVGSEFPGSPQEVLLCMASCVDTAPYVGVPESAVESYLRGMLLALVSGR